VPLERSQTLIVESPTDPAETMALPSGLMATLFTAPVWPVRVRTIDPSTARHTLIVLSPLPVTIVSPSGLIATLPIFA